MAYETGAGRFIVPQIPAGLSGFSGLGDLVASIRRRGSAAATPGGGAGGDAGRGAPPWDHAVAGRPEKPSGRPGKAPGKHQGRSRRVVKQMMRGSSATVADVLREPREKPAVEAPRAGDVPIRRGRDVEDVDMPLPEAPPDPEIEPGIYEYALTQPDILRQAETGQMTSLDLLKALLERRRGAAPAIQAPPGEGFR